MPNISLNFGEVIALDASIGPYEDYGQKDSIKLPERTLQSTKHTILKIGSAYLETYNSKEEMDKEVVIAFDDEELLMLRNNVATTVVYNGIPVGIQLKRKLYEALLKVENSKESETVNSIFTYERSS
jgi:hypothetical protein